jgi:hypothetical protein
MQWSKHLNDPIKNENVTTGWFENSHKMLNSIEMAQALL